MFESDGMIQIIGKGAVTIVDARAMSYSNQDQAFGNQPLSMHNLKLHVLSYGDHFDLQDNLPLH